MTPTIGYALAFVAGALIFGTATGNKVARKALTLSAAIAILTLAVIGALAILPRG